MWGVVCPKYSRSSFQLLGENLECVHEMSGKCPKNMWEVSKFLETFQEVSIICPGNVREVIGKCPGSVGEVSGKCPGSVREVSGKYTGSTFKSCKC